MCFFPGHWNYLPIWPGDLASEKDGPRNSQVLYTCPQGLWWIEVMAINSSHPVATVPCNVTWLLLASRGGIVCFSAPWSRVWSSDFLWPKGMSRYDVSRSPKAPMRWAVCLLLLPRTLRSPCDVAWVSPLEAARVCGAGTSCCSWVPLHRPGCQPGNAKDSSSPPTRWSRSEQLHGWTPELYVK